MQLLDSDWPANILAMLNFQAQENRLMSPDGVCAIRHESNTVRTPFCAKLNPVVVAVNQTSYTIQIAVVLK